MKLLVQLLLLMAINICNAQSPYKSISTYTLNKRYDTVAQTKELFDSNSRLVYEMQAGKSYKSHESMYAYADSSGNGLTIYKNGDSVWHWFYYTGNKLSAQRATKYNASQHQWEDTLVSSYRYNDAGQITEELIWHKKNEHGNIMLNTWNTNRILYTYNNVGKLLSRKAYYIYSLNDWDKELLKTKADRQQDTIRLTSVSFDYKPNGYTQINYDINQVDPYDTISVKYEFDKFNRVYKETERKKSILSETIIRTYSYHPEKRIDREIYYNAADKLQRVKIYVYEH